MIICIKKSVLCCSIETKSFYYKICLKYLKRPSVFVRGQYNYSLTFFCRSMELYVHPSSGRYKEIKMSKRRELVISPGFESETFTAIGKRLIYSYSSYRVVTTSDGAAPRSIKVTKIQVQTLRFLRYETGV
jgi:hypothetical protein